MNIQVVNINNLKYTKNLVNDLLAQTSPYRLRLVDQNSSEKGTEEYLKTLKYSHIDVVRNLKNIDLNRMWNKFYVTSTEPYLCFLNNDVRIPSNFVAHTKWIFEEEEKVGCVLYATNHSSYKKVTELNYTVLETKIVQGWAFTVRREAFTIIPDSLKVFGGDDWLFNKMYERVWRVAMCLSAPIIHYKAKSRKYYEGNRDEELAALKELGIPRLPYRSPYTKSTPHFINIEEED